MARIFMSDHRMGGAGGEAAHAQQYAHWSVNVAGHLPHPHRLRGRTDVERGSGKEISVVPEEVRREYM